MNEVRPDELEHSRCHSLVTVLRKSGGGLAQRIGTVRLALTSFELSGCLVAV